MRLALEKGAANGSTGWSFSTFTSAYYGAGPAPSSSWVNPSGSCKSCWHFSQQDHPYRKHGKRIYEKDLLLLLEFYQVTGGRREELLELARHAQERGWLRTYSNDAFPEDWQTWIDFEADATGVFNYEPSMIPGLLQTPEYAKAIIQATTSGLSDSDVDRLVASRMARQVRLSHAHPLKLHVIIEEGALMRPFGDAQARVRQLLHLASFAAHPNVQIQVLPIEAGLHRALYGPFAILKFGDNTRLIHLEAATSGTFLDEEDQIRVYEQTWDELCELAYNAEKSTRLISVIAAQAHDEN